MLLSYDIKPILVFDGQHLPAKALTESRRRETRKQSKKLAAELLRMGKVEEARSQLRRCVDVTHEMALRLIKECRQRNVDSIVAPYEADAQMAWLNKVDLAQYIITEDSDLTLFGARKIIFKLDLTGAGVLVESDKLHLAMGCRAENYTFDKFRRMCIISGCDYLDSLPGIGLAKACKFILKTEEDNMWRALKKLPQYLNMKKLEVNDQYIDNFLKAEATFKHMFIYNPIKRQMERLNNLEDFQTEERYCCNAGTAMEDNEQSLNLALGNLNPFSLKQLDNWNPDRDFGLAQPPPKHIKRCQHKSIWRINYQSPRKLNTDTTLNSCALHFKKVDFISKTIDEEISANLKEESAKPEEAEIFSMYKYGITASETSPIAKRQRLNSATSSCSSSSIKMEEENNDTRTITPIKMRHNPFAKVQDSAEISIQKTTAICENGSLLKVLSPRKCKLEEGAETEMTRPKNVGFRRSIFASSNETRVEVKSRFFAANIKHVNDQKLLLSNKSIESDLQQNFDNQAQHNNLTASPIDKNCSYNNNNNNNNNRTRGLTPSATDSGIESISTNNANDGDDNSSDIEVKQENDLPCTDKMIREEDEAVIIVNDDTTNRNDDDEHTNAENVIKISDDSDSLNSDKEIVRKKFSSNVFKPLLHLKEFKAKPMRGRRVGLSRPKVTTTATTTKTKISNSTTANSVANNNTTSQTRLSMFGFQKRPVLK